MTSRRAVLGWIGALLAWPALAQRDPLAPSPEAGPERGASPESLRAEIAAIARRFNGRAGIAIVNLRDRWEIDFGADRLFPQQSCSKLWVAITLLDEVDEGRVSLDRQVTIHPRDLTLFHQPLAELVRRKGSHTTTLGALLFQAITESDNTANDTLLRSIGGPDAVRATIRRKGLGAIRFYNGERSLQSRIAGLTWSQGYSVGNAFSRARAALPFAVRKAAFDRYLDDPFDGASPRAVARALARLKRGELLSPGSTRRLLAIMGRTRTGRARVRAALARGWDWNHKTGTGQELHGRIGGINDIGLLTAPDGTVYAMALMTVPNTANGGAQGLMQAVTRAVIASHRGR
ncbi:serine hydrolase [Sphingomonas sp. ASV193]|uniref:serine hydrolase n=1 Tax=Sphingomonas sp. ASV193 TaxID=3144405 RepID=UPI0032E8BE78